MSPKQETAEEMAAMPETCRSRNSVMREEPEEKLPSREWDKLTELNPEERMQGKGGQKAGWFMCQRAQLERNGA